jgi:hypothetical protein
LGASSTGVASEIPLFQLLTSNLASYPSQRQCMVGSLTGAVASEKVSEAYKGRFSTLGNRALSARAQTGLTVRPTSRAETKVGPSDPVVLSGRAIAQRIKGTPGITG